jgi:hypothetical protein
MEVFLGATCHEWGLVGEEDDDLSLDDLDGVLSLPICTWWILPFGFPHRSCSSLDLKNGQEDVRISFLGSDPFFAADTLAVSEIRTTSFLSTNRFVMKS